MITLGSLFDGISGFPLSAQRVGITSIWASEIEPFPMKVSEIRFPNMKQLGDITKIKYAAELQREDIMGVYLRTRRKLEVEKENDFLDIEVEDNVTIELTNGDCIVAEILEIREDELLVNNEDGVEITIQFNTIVDIELD